MSEINLLKGDCYELIKDIPDNSIDLIFTDPPYNITQYGTPSISFDDRKTPIKNNIAEWDKKEFNPKLLLEDFKRIIKPNGNIFAFTNYNQIGKWYEAFNDEFDTFQIFVWHKTNPTPAFRKTSFLKSIELLVCMWNKVHNWNFTTQNEMHNFFESPICMGNERLKNPKHPTQKPLKILKHLMKIGSNPGDIVFDPFMGVGSVGAACQELDRNFIGIEIDKEYFKASQERLALINGKNR